MGIGGCAAAVVRGRARPLFDSFWARRLQSLLGIVPVGLFVLLHLYANLVAARGPGPYDRLVRTLESAPLLLALEIGVLYLPILAHAVIGLHIAFAPKFNLPGYPYARNWQFYLQRLSGMVALVFIAYHVVTLRLLPGLSHGHASFALVAGQLHRPAVLALYLVGTVGTVFHFASGLWSFSIHWGIAVGRRAQRAAAYLSGAVFVALCMVLGRILLSFA